MTNRQKQFLNWSGPIVLLLAYMLISLGVVSSGYIFHLLNVLGSTLVIVSLWNDRKERAALIVFNLFWIGVAVAAIGKLLFFR